MMAQRILAVDPGREKCGVAVVDREQGPLWHKVVATNRLIDTVTALAGEYDCRIVALGNQTSAAAARQRLQPLLDQAQLQEIVMVDERNSTEKARFRYWQDHSATGWRRFIPRGLLIPPCAVDDFAAIILGERYFEKNI